MVSSALASIFANLIAGAPTPAPTAVPERIPLPAPTAATRATRWTEAGTVLSQEADAAQTAAKKGDPWALARMYRVWNLNRLLDRPDRVMPMLETLTEAKDPVLKDHAQFMQAELLRREGRLEEARARIKNIGLVTDAMIIGPFDNAAGSGHDTSYPPEQGMDVSAPTPGKSGPVRWRSIAGLAPDGILELSSILHPPEEGTAYVAVVLEATRPMSVVLRLGSVDQIAVFVQGQKVFARDHRRFLSLDQDAVPLSLQRGPNLLLLKSSWTDRLGRLAFRLTTKEGRQPQGLKIWGDPNRVTQAYQQTRFGKVTPARPEPSIRDRLKLPRSNGPKRAEALALDADLIAVVGLYDGRKLPSLPEERLEEAIRNDPSHPMHRFFFGHRVAARDPNLAQIQLEAALVSDPGHVPSLFRLGDMARARGRRLDSLARFDAALEKDPRFIPAVVARAALTFDDLGEGPLVLERLAAHPDAEHPAVLEERARMLRALQDTAAARTLLKTILTKRFDAHLSRRMAINLALAASEPKTALRLVEDALHLRPHVLDLYLEKTRILSGLGRRDDAFSTLELATARFPDHPDVALLSAELWLSEGKTTPALAELDRALTLDPQQIDVRRHRRILSGQSEELEDRYSIDPLTLLDTPVSEAERRFGAAYLTERRAVRLFKNGKSTRFEQWVIRLTNPQLEDALRGHRIYYSPSRESVEILDAQRIRPSREIVKAAQIHDEGPQGKVAGMYVDQRYRTIVFDDLAAGDLVHIRFRVDSVGQNLFGGFFGDMAPVSASIPKHDVLYTAIAPTDVPLFPGQVDVPNPTKTKIGDDVALTWRFDSVDALEAEPMSPPYPQLGRMISVSTYASWNDLGAWYARLYTNQMELDEDARQAGRNAIRGAKTEAEKIRRLYHYVVKNTRYVGIELGIHGWKPFKAAEVHRRRYGDCKDKSTLLAALLKDNGIDAVLTLVRTVDRGWLPENHATMWAFNHAITYVPSADLFLDPTAEFSGSTELPYLDQGAQALVVYPDGQTKVRRLPKTNPKENLNHSEYEATFERDTRLIMTGVERFEGARASEMRQELDQVEDRATRLQRQLASTFAGVQVDDAVEVSNLTDLEAPVEYRYRFRVPRYGQAGPNGARIPLALFRHEVASVYATLAKRTQPLFIPLPWSTRNTIRYRLPSGAQIEHLPEGKTVDSKHIALVQTVKKTDDGFETDDVVTLKSNLIPLEDYAEFRRACLAIDRAMARNVEIAW